MGESEKNQMKWFMSALITTALTIIVSTAGSYISTMNRMTKIETNFDNQCREIERIRNSNNVFFEQIQTKVDKTDYKSDMQEVKQDLKDIKHFLMSNR